MKKMLAIGSCILLAANSAISAESQVLVCRMNDFVAQVSFTGKDPHRKFWGTSDYKDLIYREWNSQDGDRKKYEPDLEIKGGDVNASGTGMCLHYNFIFKNGDKEIIIQPKGQSGCHDSEYKPPKNGAITFVERKRSIVDEDKAHSDNYLDRRFSCDATK